MALCCMAPGYGYDMPVCMRWPAAWLLRQPLTKRPRIEVHSAITRGMPGESQKRRRINDRGVSKGFTLIDRLIENKGLKTAQ